MRKLKLYLETSAIAYLFAFDVHDKMEDSNRLWHDFEAGKYDLFISPLVMDELVRMADPKRSKIFQKLEHISFQCLSKTEGVDRLAKEYVYSGVFNAKRYDDCLHIAFAAVHDCDIVLSWDFKHLVNYKAIHKIKLANAMNHYRDISVISPTMLIEEDDEL